MKNFLAPRTPAPAPGLAWAAPAMAPVPAGTGLATPAVLQRTHAPRQLTLPLQARARA